MNPSLPRPSISNRPDGFQLSYELPHRLYLSKLYPLKSRNGSTIIIYGYEHGIGFLWRGGKRRKLVEDRRESKLANGRTDANNSVIIIGSDDEEPPQTVVEPVAEFEAEEEKVDSSYPYEPILATVFRHLGVGALFIAVPNMSSEELQNPSEAVPVLFRERLFVAAACSDCAVRILSLPLIPPPPESPLPNPYEEQAIILGGSSGHQSIPRGITLSFSSRRNRLGTEGQENKLELLVASYSDEISGLILIYRIPITKGAHGGLSVSADYLAPIQRVPLSSPAITLNFRPVSILSSRPPQLLITHSNGSVRILSSSTSRPNRRHQPSRDSSSSSLASDVMPSRWFWTLTLYAGFEHRDGLASERKRIVSADWVLSGKAVICLLANGQWGIWDMEGAGPKSPKQSITRKETAPNVLSGGALTNFSIEDSLGASMPSIASTQKSSTKSMKNPLAPMTPSTRRVREEVLFHKQAIDSDAYLPGSISVQAIRPCSKQAESDDRVVLALGDRIMYIPSLYQYWQARLGGSNIFTSKRYTTRVIEGPDLSGENQLAIDFLSLPLPVEDERIPPSDSLDLLITSDTRLNMVTTKSQSMMQNLSTNPFEQAQLQSSSVADQQLLSQGDLDIDGMNRLLDSMAGNGPRFGTEATKPQPQKKVGFATSR